MRDGSWRFLVGKLPSRLFVLFDSVCRTQDNDGEYEQCKFENRYHIPQVDDINEGMHIARNILRLLFVRSASALYNTIQHYVTD